MFEVAFSIGIYSYFILVLGLLGWLTKPNIIIVTLISFVAIFLYMKKQIAMCTTKLQELINNFQVSSKEIGVLQNTQVKISNNKIVSVSLILLFLLTLCNLIGAFGPELGFDALWYHLTLPKLYLIHHAVNHIPGGLLYYSEMPRLTEILYTAALAIDSEILAKIIHFSFGILSAIVVYKVAREFFDRNIALLAVVIFYGNLVVDWESITAYIDLARTFFEVLAFFAFTRWIKTDEKTWFIESAVSLGLAVCSKTIALGSIGIFIVLITVYLLQQKTSFSNIIKQNLLFIFIAILIPLPWFIIAYLNTENPFFPIFTNYEVHQTFWQIINPIRFIESIWNIFTHSPDPLNPIYILFFPLLAVNVLKLKRGKTKAVSIKRENRKKSFVVLFSSGRIFQHLGEYLKILQIPEILKFSPCQASDLAIALIVQDDKEKNSFFFIILYSLFAILVWYVTPQTGGGRFILPYLPVFSILTVSVLTFSYPVRFKKFLICLIFLSIGISLVYRAEANKKYLPVIFGQETKADFLTKNLNFSFGDFYDVDGYFFHHILPNQTVLLYGFHNLYYIDFPFIDSSWVQPGDRFDYIATQNTDLPKRFRFWELVYTNPKTKVNLYMYHHNQWIY